ncbi:WXG100 family type VII secretion target [Saccharopolyspora sp. CA-218241]|uniref:WXG100 family type VII secretion target n=1 Tax=Saccharopolyspora sp. CA-218241 TaxID=3240027 RepID=UPI003D99F0EF
MLWQNADVGDVSATAAEWERHSTALVEHADSLRHQGGALRASWSSTSADLAVDRLGTLEQRTSGIGDRAGTVQRATQDAGDALAVARNTMPPPPGDALGLAASSAAAGAGAGAAIGGVLGAGAGGVGAGPGAVMGAAIGAVAAGGASLFLASVAAAEKKAEAVHVMQRYEDDLRRSSQAISSAGGAGARATEVGDGTETGAGTPAAPARTTAAGVSGGAAAGGGTPWGHLVSADPLAGGRSGLLDAALPARGAGSGLARGAGSGLAARAGGAGGMLPPGVGRRGEDEDEVVHQNRLPTLDNGLFDDDRPASEPVIGL